MDPKEKMNWNFIDDQGTFELDNPQESNYLYFPLINSEGMMSSITPSLNGDSKINQNAFLLLPVSVEDLHNSRAARNFWVRINGEPWSVSGNSAYQIYQSTMGTEEEARLEAGFLWHRIRRKHSKSGLTASVLNFVSANGDPVELMRVTLTNQGSDPVSVDPIAAIPIYGRSADNLRDHRHVTALLHNTVCHPFGVLVKPSMSFDERGHTINQTTYGVLGMDGDGNPPEGFTPLVEDFIGEGGNLAWPKTVLRNDPELTQAGSAFEGFESMGGLHFPCLTLQPGESKSYILILCILSGEEEPTDFIEKYGEENKFGEAFKETKLYWRERLAALHFDHQQGRRDGWLQWVTLQPELRRIMGNSFLPYHDYGRGGRGWRDLWQDLLAILLTHQTKIDDDLLNHFAGIRMDGSNATIVGSRPGEFKADRNSIPRVWMDHGAWPLITTQLYLDQTGDLEFLLRKQSYFRDHLTHRCQWQDFGWDPESGTKHLSTSGDVIEGSVLEHLMVQHLTVFFNVGEHNLIKLEGGDWNDGLDMASERGESVAFSGMYAGNLKDLSELCLALVEQGINEIPLSVEILPLLDHISDPVDYDSVEAKQRLLHAYFDAVKGELSGEQAMVSLKEIAADLETKAVWLSSLIREQEWVSDREGRSWFNGYYDNQGERLEGETSRGCRMTLTGQVFPLMAGVATQEQARQVVRAADYYLYDPSLSGYHLNTNFGEDLPELGRAFGFAYGHKENGAAFSHMSVMFAYALYHQGLVEEGWRILDGLYNQSQDFPVSRMYPGIPEYFNPRGRGLYPYLTGSAAWYIFTLLTESFGFKGSTGDLVLEPKLVSSQFSHSDRLSLHATFAGKRFNVVYLNPERLSFGQYCLGEVLVNQQGWENFSGGESVTFSREEVIGWPDANEIRVHLRANKDQ